MTNHIFPLKKNEFSYVLMDKKGKAQEKETPPERSENPLKLSFHVTTKLMISIAYYLV